MDIQYLETITAIKDMAIKTFGEDYIYSSFDISLSHHEISGTTKVEYQAYISHSVTERILVSAKSVSDMFVVLINQLEKHGYEHTTLSYVHINQLIDGSLS